MRPGHFPWACLVSILKQKFKISVLVNYGYETQHTKVLPEKIDFSLLHTGLWYSQRFSDLGWVRLTLFHASLVIRALVKSCSSCGNDRDTRGFAEGPVLRIGKSSLPTYSIRQSKSYSPTQNQMSKEVQLPMQGRWRR